MKPVPLKRVKRSDREQRVLMGLVALYLESGKPIGSNTLKESGFDDLSSATIRNYFARLEGEGFLRQPHVSGGREPTAKAFQLYAQENLEADDLDLEDEKAIATLAGETKEITTYLQKAAELLSGLTGYATFLSAPRFDHDFVLDIKVVVLDPSRCMCIILTDFGSVISEVMQTEQPLDKEGANRLESYFGWRIGRGEKPEGLARWELALAQTFYNELMLRYITRYSSFTQAEITRTGFAKLLDYPEFNSAAALASSLALFESGPTMTKLLQACEKRGDLSFWIGEGLASFLPTATHCSVIAIPYAINGAYVGAIGLLGPMRMPYPRLFAILRHFAETVSQSLSKSLYKYKIQYRQPQAGTLYLEDQERRLLVDQRNKEEE